MKANDKPKPPGPRDGYVTLTVAQWREQVMRQREIDRQAKETTCPTK